MAYNALNNLIDAYIYANGVQAITGQILNGVLKQMVSQLGSGYHLMGVAGPGTIPEQNDYAMAYFAATVGEYTGFGGITLAAGEVAVLLTYGNGSWSKQTIYNVPTGTADLENTANFITNAVTDLVNYYTKTEVDTTLENYPTLSALATTLADYYTKTEIDTTLADYATKDGVDEALADYYDKDEVDAELADRYTKSETDTKLGDYYKKTETYDKDEVDSIIAALSRQEYIVAWDGLAAPDVSAIPAGVSVTYSGTTYTGTLAASASTVKKIYMVWNGTAYDMYATSQDGGYSWVPMGTTTVDLSQYATKDEVSQLEHKVDENKEDANANFYGRKQNYTIGSIDENSVFSVEAYHDTIVSDFIPVSPGDVVEWGAGDSGLFLCVYNDSKTYISGQYWVSQTPLRTVTLSNASTAYIRITALSAYDSYVKVNDVVVWKKMDLSLPIYDNKLHGYTFEVFAKNGYGDWISGYIRNWDGGLTSSSANSCTSFIPIGKFKKVELVMSIIASTSNASVCFYDGNMVFISSYTSNMGAERSFEKRVLDVPTNAKYIRASLYTQFLAEWFLVGFYEGDIIPVFEKVDGESRDYEFGYLDQYSVINSSADDIITGFIPVKQGDSVVWHNGYASDSGSRALCAYDADKNMISGQYWGAGGTYFPERTISLSSASLSGVAFIRASMSAKYDAYILVNNEKVWRREDATPGIGVDDVFLVGSPKIKLTESLAESYTDISTKRVSELYDAWDALVLAHPDYLSRDADLGNVTKDGNTFAIRQYTFGYNKKVLLDHEPTADETISDNQWLDVFDRNKILVVSGMHGEEHTPTWGLMLAVGAILESDEEWAKYIKDNATWKIIPCLNPTGWDLCIRECSTGAVLNRNEAANAPEAVIYMDWIGANKDAKILLDFHGTQGHYAYLPVNRGLPFHNTIYRLANSLGSAFRSNWRTFYESVSEGYGTTYSPYIVAKYSTVWDIGHFACRMYDTYKMQSFAIETPDNLTDGLIGNNDLRMCKLTKDMAINIFQSLIPVRILQTN